MSDQIQNEVPVEVAPVADPAPVSVSEEAKTVSVPTSAFSKIKREAEERGRKAASSEFEAKLKEHGFNDFDSFVNAMTAMHKGQPAEKPAEKAKAATPAQQQKTSDEAYKMARELERARKEAEKASREKRRLQEMLDAKEAEFRLKQIAMQTGIRDVDYAVHLLTGAIETKSEDDLKSFNETEYFKNLRSSHPYLFGEVAVPATTGTAGGSSAPAAPAPGTAAQQMAKNAAFDARTASADDFKRRLAQLGINANRM
jgi:hypothetical protein